MGTVDYVSDALAAAGRALAGEGPVYMVNLVRYRDQAEYGSETDLPPCSGREAYLQRYAPAFQRVAAGEAFSVFWVGNVRHQLVAPEHESWDDIVIVQYADFDTLRRILEKPQYESEAAPHRRAALADWRFIATTQLNLAG